VLERRNTAGTRLRENGNIQNRDVYAPPFVQNQNVRSFIRCRVSEPLKRQLFYAHPVANNLQLRVRYNAIIFCARA